MNVENFIICDLNNQNRKPANDRMHSFEAKFSEALAIDDFNLTEEPVEKFHDVNEIELKLRNFINEEGMKIMVSDNEISEAFVSSPTGYSVILLPKSDLKEKGNYRICALAHELGHYMDYKHNFNFDNDAFCEYSDDEDSNILTETIAWAYAKDILTVLGYTEWSTFEEIAIWSLSSYTDDVEYAYDNINDLDSFKVKRYMVQKMYCH